MKNNYWIKLYYELREDMKVFRLSDSAFRRFILLMLLAGEHDRRDGTLPDIDDISFLLRVDVDQLQSDLYELEQVGIVEMRGGVPFLVNFAKRQEPKSGAARVAAYRERQRKQEYYGGETSEKRSSNDTVTKRYTDKIRLDKDTDKIRDAAPGAFSSFENKIHPIASMTQSQRIEDLIIAHGEKNVIDAIETAAENGKRSLGYVEGILRNWRDNGRKTKAKPVDHYDAIVTAIAKYGGAHGAGGTARDALPADVWESINDLGGWYHVCGMSKDDIRIQYYMNRKKAAAHV
jgi:DnaD/phage-associated family protein